MNSRRNFLAQLVSLIPLTFLGKKQENVGGNNGKLRFSNKPRWEIIPRYPNDAFHGWTFKYSDKVTWEMSDSLKKKWNICYDKEGYQTTEINNF